MDNSNPNILPSKIKNYLNDRGLSDFVLTIREISYNGRIVIPIFDHTGKKIFNKYRRDPFGNDSGPKYSYDKGSKSSLYGVDLIDKAEEIIICEGELDSLALISKGVAAVTSTGGAGTFLAEWAPLFKNKKTYVCFDNDQAGRKGIINVVSHVPHALCIPLPAEVKDITDYFTKLNKTADDFRDLMAVAFELDAPAPPPPERKGSGSVLRGSDFDRAKGVAISEFIKVNHEGFAPCPFHKEKTASLKVDKVNRFYCYGCSKWGDVIDIVQQLYSLPTPRDAVNFILKK